MMLGFPGGESSHKMKRCVEIIVLMMFPPAAAAACCCSVYNLNLCQYICHSESQPMLWEAKRFCFPEAVPLQNHHRQPQLALSFSEVKISAGSLIKMDLSFASHTLLCNSCWLYSTLSSVLQSL